MLGHLQTDCGAALPGMINARRPARMTLNRLKLIATIVPIVAVIILEVAREVLLGPLPIVKRLQLDLFVVTAIIIFSTVIFRYVAAMQKRLEHQNQELLALHSAGLAISAELSLDAVLKKVVDEARRLVGAKYGAVSVVDREGHIDQFVTSGISAHDRAAIGAPPVGHGVLGVVLREGERLRLHDVGAHPRSSGFPANHPMMKTLLAVPIESKGPFLGNIYLSERNDGGDFSTRDEETLIRFAVQAAIAIDNAHLHAQAADLAVAQERVRIAHEMHDGLAQVLGYVNTKVQAADAYLKRGKQEEASEQLRQLAVSAREAYVEVREGIVGLRTLPEPDRPLGDVLRQYLTQWEEQTGISTALTLEGEIRLRPVVELQLVRIVQEALTNARKHARASRVSVDLRKVEGHIVLTIADNGVGFNTDVRHRSEFPQFGLSTMRERSESVGATLEVESGPGQGTVIRFSLPPSGTGAPD
jgi:nitrate/nitrite-specific signal transduction histidine kinase